VRVVQEPRQRRWQARTGQDARNPSLAPSHSTRRSTRCFRNPSSAELSPPPNDRWIDYHKPRPPTYGTRRDAQYAAGDAPGPRPPNGTIARIARRHRRILASRRGVPSLRCIDPISAGAALLDPPDDPTAQRGT